MSEEAKLNRVAKMDAGLEALQAHYEGPLSTTEATWVLVSGVVLGLTAAALIVADAIDRNTTVQRHKP